MTKTIANTLTAAITAPATAISVVRVTTEDGSDTLLMLTGAEGVQPVMVPASIVEGKEQELVDMFTTPFIGGLLLRKFLSERGCGVVRPEILANVEVVIPATELDDSVQADGAVSKNMDTGEVTKHGSATDEDVAEATAEYVGE